jgi:hypothetical protein
MGSADFFTDVEVENPFLCYPEVKQALNTELLESMRSCLPSSRCVRVRRSPRR